MLAGASAGLTAVLVLGWTGSSLADPDVWWHVRTGRLILDEGSVPHSDPWSFTADEGSWVPTAWLGDVILAAAWHLGGYDGVRLLRVLLAAAVVAALWLLARRFATSTVSAAWGFLLVLLAVAPFLRERPQVVSFLFVVWLAWLIQRALAGVPPPLVSSVLMTFAWANLHGMWVLAPIGLLGAGVLAWLDDRSRVPLAARCTTVAVFGWLSALATPAGPRLAWWPLVVQRAAAPITEWEPTRPLAALALPFSLAVVLIVLRWSRAPSPVPRSERLYLLAVTTFGLLAFRNVAPAAILLLPLLVGRAARRPAVNRTSRPALAVLAVGVAAALVRLTATDTVAGSQPTRIADALADRPGSLRVLNHYDVGGLLTGTASPPVRVAIDGRTDMWSPRYVRDYLDATSGARDWRPLVDALQPQAAVLPRDNELTRGLQAERGWRVTLADGDWVLLEPGA